MNRPLDQAHQHTNRTFTNSIMDTNSNVRQQQTTHPVITTTVDNTNQMNQMDPPTKYSQQTPTNIIHKLTQHIQTTTATITPETPHKKERNTCEKKDSKTT